MMSNTPQSSLAVVVGGFVNGLGLVRALSPLNTRIVIITTETYDIAQYSKYIHEHYHLSDLEGHPKRLVELLEEHAKDWIGAIVFPTTDSAIASLYSHYECLSKWYRIVVPPLDSVPYVLDKSLMLKAATEVGIMTPRCYGPATEAKAMEEQIKYPVVIKAVRAGEFVSRFGKKLFRANTREELMSCTRLLADARIEGQIFDLIPGADDHIFAYCVYVDKDCAPIAECTIHKLRQSPPSFGIARVAECVPNIPDLREQTIELLRHIGFRGFVSAEFKYDSRDSSYRFFEINGRSVTYNSLLRRGGLDVAKLAWLDYVKGDIKPVETRVWKGVWIHLHADILRYVLNRKSEQDSFNDFLRPYRCPKTFAVWSVDDPRPFLSQWWLSLREAVRAFQAGTIRDRIAIKHIAMKKGEN
jgi:predicted ATP-grasp superfamily ATP-dependent carboligase